MPVGGGSGIWRIIIRNRLVIEINRVRLNYNGLLWRGRRYCWRMAVNKWLRETAERKRNQLVWKCGYVAYRVNEISRL
jgi:hypothetical protein